MVVLDTNVFSALMRSEPGAVARLLARTPDQVRVPQPVVAEICHGLGRLRRSRRRAMLETRFERLLEALPRAEWTDEVSRHFGLVKAELERAGRRLEDFDVAIAAHALALDAALATGNVRHFRRVPELRVEDWTRPV
jgi:tRNA(fMet)-specific endonuclease VapC